jgi:Autophagy protein Atg8 ubiquitin like
MLKIPFFCNDGRNQEKKTREKKMDAEKVRRQFPNTCLLSVEKGDASTLPSLKSSKVFVPYDQSWGQFIAKLRGQMKLEPIQALIVFVKTKNGELDLVPAQTLMSKVDADFRQSPGDGVVHVVYQEETVFG